MLMLKEAEEEEEDILSYLQGADSVLILRSSSNNFQNQTKESNK